MNVPSWKLASYRFAQTCKREAVTSWLRRMGSYLLPVKPPLSYFWPAVFCFCLFFSVIFLAWFLHTQPFVQKILLMAIYVVLGVPYLFSLFESIASLKAKPRAETENTRTADNFDATIIVSAYLPNEQHIVTSTLKHILTNVGCPGNLQVLFAYNTPQNLPVENQLKRLADQDKRLKILRVDGSLRKATNMNAAIQYATGDVIAFVDADTEPEPDCLIKAHHWIRRGYDFVQGAKLIKNTEDSWVARVVSIEFLEKHFVSYQGRFSGANVTYFAGSNGYGRNSLLKGIKFSPSMQVEDIDASIRCMLSGRKLAFDPGIHSYELAPSCLGDWWKQRKRWAIGWAELTKEFQTKILSTSHLDFTQKVIWTYFLTGRRIILPVLQLTVPIMIAPVLFSGNINIFLGLNFLLGVLAIISCLVQGLAIRWWVSPSSRHLVRPASLLAYALIFPFYDFLRNLTIMRGLGAFFFTENNWEVTPRKEQALQIQQ